MFTYFVGRIIKFYMESYEIPNVWRTCVVKITKHCRWSMINCTLLTCFLRSNPMFHISFEMFWRLSPEFPSCLMAFIPNVHQISICPSFFTVKFQVSFAFPTFFPRLPTSAMPLFPPLPPPAAANPRGRPRRCRHAATKARPIAEPLCRSHHPGRNKDWDSSPEMGQNPGTVPWTPSHSWVKMDVNNPLKMYL